MWFSTVNQRILTLVIINIIILFSNPALLFTRSVESLTVTLKATTQIPSAFPIITATNAQNLTIIARVCARSAEGCGSPVSWSPDNKQLAISSTTGIDLFDLQHFDQPSKHISAPEKRLERFSPDWRLVAVINRDGSVDVWNVQTAEKKFTIPLTNSNIGALKFSPGGQYLALTSYDYSVRLWDVDTNTQVHVWAEHQNGDPLIEFSPDGSVLAITISPTLRSRFVQLWNISKGQIITDLNIEGENTIVSDIAFSADSNILVVSSNQNISAWNVKIHTKLFALDLDFKFDWALGSIFSPDSKILASFGRQRIYLWNVATQKQIARIDGLGLDGVSVRFGNDGSWLFSTDQSNEDSKPHVRLWDTISGKKLSDFVNELSPGLSPDGTMLATSEVGSSVVIRAVK